MEKKCNVADCAEITVARGFCDGHYRQVLKHGKITRKNLKKREVGNSTHPLYRTWHGMKSRCLNKNTKSYKHYGARGISVCEEWSNSFQAFAAYVGDKPSPKHTIDRIDNDGDYKPGNVRWATSYEQAINKRKRHQSSGETNIRISRCNTFEVRIMRQYKEVSIGSFKTMGEAIEARDRALMELEQ